MNLTARVAATSNRSGSARDHAVGAAAVPASTPASKAAGHPHARLLGLLAISVLGLLAFASSALADPPKATTPVISDISYSSATLTSTISHPGGFATNYTFEYSKDPDGEGWTTGPAGQVTGSDPKDETVNPQLAGLEDGSEYFVRITAKNLLQPPDAIAPAAAPYPSFTTLVADPPTIPGAVAATGVFSTSATATGEINRPVKSDDVNCTFEYISDEAFNNNPPGEGFVGATPLPCETGNPDEIPGKIAAMGNVPVSTKLTGLSPEATYHLRLSVSAAGGSDAKDAANFTTAAKVAAPSVTKVNDATDLSYRTATLAGEVQRPAGPDPALDIFSCRFEYVTAEQFTNSEFAEASPVGCDQTAGGPISSEGLTPVTASLTGLKSGVTYHYRLAAENSGGTDTKDAANAFATTPGGEPTITLDPNPITGPTMARVTGTVSRGLAFNDSRVFVTFEGAEAGSEGFSGGPYIEMPPGTGPLPFSYDLAGLNQDTEYEFRVTVEEREGEDSGNAILRSSSKPNPTATTGHLESPTASCDPVTDFTATTAHFSCTVDTQAPAGPLNDLEKVAYKTDWRIECVPECKDVNGNPISGTVEGDEGSKAIGGDAKRLDPNTNYQVKLVAHNELYEVETPTEEFETDLIKPTVKAFPGGSDGKGGYVLQGTVNPNASQVTDCTFGWGPGAPASGGTKPTDYAFQADCSPKDPGAGAKPVTVEAPLTSLNPGTNYQFRLFATNEAGEEMSEILEFTPELAKANPCPNEQLRVENSSLALPECRAYEMVTPPGKEGFGARLETFDGGERVAYRSGATNIARSGQAAPSANEYVAARTVDGWETIPNLNGSSGSLRDAPLNVDSESSYVGIQAYSSDLLSSVWRLHQKGDPDLDHTDTGSPTGFPHLRRPDGTFAPIGSTGTGSDVYEYLIAPVAVSADLSHVVTWSGSFGSEWGPGVYEFVGTGMGQPHRVDLDNSGAPISSCVALGGNARNESISSDGSRIVNYVIGGCGGANPPANELWARVNDTTSFDVSASQCDRVTPACNAPSNPTFAAATPDGSRVFFTTTQQLVDGDIDQTNDIYACDLPSGNPAPSADKSNPCAAFRQVSGAQTGADVESVNATSENGSTVLFTAKGVLADNEDALKEKAVAGDHNLYVWRTGAAHPDGQTSFVARLDSNDLRGQGLGQGTGQATPDGRYLVFTTDSRLIDTDTDSARDAYRYDANNGDLTRVSTNVYGVAGNGGLNAEVAIPTEHNPSATVSDDGTKIVFTTTEALSPADGNAEPDVYLWTPDRVSLISTGSSGFAPRSENSSHGIQNPKVAIDPAGEDIYFETAQALTPADGDSSTDVYDARIGGGFGSAEPTICSGEKCQPDQDERPETPKPQTEQPPADGGNVVAPKPCPKGKVRNKKGKCVKKPKKHRKKNGKDKGKKAGHKQGGGR